MSRISGGEVRPPRGEATLAHVVRQKLASNSVAVVPIAMHKEVVERIKAMGEDISQFCEQVR